MVGSSLVVAKTSSSIPGLITEEIVRSANGISPFGLRLKPNPSGQLTRRWPSHIVAAENLGNEAAPWPSVKKVV